MKLKKSLLIVPAMGTLLLAAAGSVGGTVAWFSANSTYDLTASQFAVGSLEANLDVALANIHGFKNANINSAAKTISLDNGELLADASFNHTARTLFTDTGNTNNGLTANGYTLLDTMTDAGVVGTDANWIAKANYDGDGEGKQHNLHWAVAWKMTFTLTMPTTGIAHNLYFNNYTSGALESAITKADSTKEKQTHEGFRIAFVALTGNTDATGATRVWAPFVDTSDATLITTADNKYTNLKYVSDDNPKTETSYGTGELMLKAASAPTTTGTSTDTGATYLGQFAGTANANSVLNLACVAWFEGTDSNVVSTASFNTITSLAMNFYTMPIA